jgi:hypothetical protein
MTGHTQKATGAAIARSARTLRRWEGDADTWSQAREEAGRRWLDTLIDASRATLLAAIKAGNAELALKILERKLDELAPPRLHVNLVEPF